MEHIIWSINPNIFEFRSIQLRWYGLLFFGSFFLGLMLLQWIYKCKVKDLRYLTIYSPTSC